MFRCPRCQQELPANARFCNHCGFNQTNAHLDSLRAAQDALNASSSPVKQAIPPSNPIPSRPRVPETPPPVIQPSKGNSLTGRYMSEQETRQELASGVPRTVATPDEIVDQTPRPSVPVTPPSSLAQRGLLNYQTERIEEPSSMEQPFAWQFGLPDTFTASKDDSADSVDNKSLSATNKAAEQWRQSWRDRQRAEAGPAVNVSRGQASVPEPLLAMQHSIARMRAIVLPKSQSKENNFGFWIIIVMMVCLFVGLISYIVWSYLPGVQLASQSIPILSGAKPTLSFEGQDAKRSNFSAGQTIHVQGQFFGAHDQIIFFLETTTLNSSDGKPVTVTTDSHGAFAARLTIPATQPDGEYVLQTQDNRTGQHAFLTITVRTATTSTTALSLSFQGNPISSLTFASIAGKKDPPAKTINITNTSNSALSWTVAAVTNDTTGWLVIDDSQTGGQLDAQKSSSVDISVLTQGLKMTDKAHPYKGEIIFTVSNQGQMILPVELQIADAGVEVVITPNPILAAPSATALGTCPNTSLTLINLNTTPVNWTVKPADAFNAQHIHVDGQTSESNILNSSGSTGDSKVIQLTCIGVQLGSTYTLTVYYNGQTESVPVDIRNS